MKKNKYRNLSKRKQKNLFIKRRWSDICDPYNKKINFSIGQKDFLFVSAFNSSKHWRDFSIYDNHTKKIWSVDVITTSKHAYETAENQVFEMLPKHIKEEREDVVFIETNKKYGKQKLYQIVKKEEKRYAELDKMSKTEWINVKTKEMLKAGVTVHEFIEVDHCYAHSIGLHMCLKHGLNDDQAMIDYFCAFYTKSNGYLVESYECLSDDDLKDIM